METRYLDAAGSRMFVGRMDGHLAAGQRLVLGAAPAGAPAPPGYAWPGVGDVSRGPAALGGLAPAAQHALVALLAVGGAALVAGGGAAAFVWRKRRRQQEQQQAWAGGKAAGGAGAAAANGSGGVGGFGPRDSDLSGSNDCVRCRPGSDGAAAGALKGGAAAAAEDAFEDGAAAGRWRQLLVAINSRVADIHAKRLAAGLSARQPSATNSGAGSEPLPLLPRRSFGGPPGASFSQRRALLAAAAGAGGAAGASQWDLGADAALPQLVLGAAERSGSATVARSGGSFRSGGSQTLAAPPRHGQPQQLQIVETLGSGTFGTVFRARWHGSEVAVKLVQLPATLVGGPGAAGGGDGNGGAGGGAAGAFASARERMAIQEAAISTTMTHPSIVSLYCIGLRPVHAGQQPDGDGSGGAGDGPDADANSSDGGGADGSGAAPPVRRLGSSGGAGGAGDAANGVVVAWELQLSESEAPQILSHRASAAAIIACPLPLRTDA